MNASQTVAHVQYNNHIKESLLSGKPVEYSMKDFLPGKLKQKKRVKQTSAIEKEILAIMEKNKAEYAGIENMFLRRTLLANEVMKMMSEAKTIEELKEIYSTYITIIYNTPVNTY